MSIENRNLFYKRCAIYFGDRKDEFISLLNEEPKSGFFINQSKAPTQVILKNIDFKYEKSSHNPNSYYCEVESIGKTKAYELGLIYPQDIESSLPATFVDYRDIKYAIDLCAAPGGKTINVLNNLNKESLLLANDVSSQRVSVLSSNLERLGLDNVIVTNDKPSNLAKNLEAIFDLVILDAPCSGEGMIRKYPEILDEYNINNILSLASIQKELLENAYKLLAKDGQLLYSTCTYALEEDERQIETFLALHSDMELVKLPHYENSSKLAGTLKLSPLNNCEGQFICLMRKISGQRNKPKLLKNTNNKVVDNFIKNNLDIDNYYLYENNNKYYLSLEPIFETNCHLIKEGIYIGELIKGRFEPSHFLYRANSLINKYKYHFNLNDEQYDKYIKGYEIKADLPDAYYQITYKDLSLGYGKCAKGIIKNKYPKGLRKR